ncbi:hypothetical protein FKM82_001300 [Ascaphus truei]
MDRRQIGGERGYHKSAGPQACPGCLGYSYTPAPGSSYPVTPRQPHTTTHRSPCSSFKGGTLLGWSFFRFWDKLDPSQVQWRVDKKQGEGGVLLQAERLASILSLTRGGYRMCICHLPCRQLKPGQSEEEVPGKMGAHYHCIICTATIARRTDMIGHIKRHVNKGETEVRFASVKSEEILKEANTDVQVLPNFKTPQKTDTFFNPKMKNNRQLIFCTLAVLAEERKKLECLDAFGSTGIMGLQWAKHLGNSVRVTINDINENSVAMIRENCHLNKMKVLTQRVEEDEEEPEAAEEGAEYLGAIEVTQLDANVLMHLRPFDFM